VVRVAELRAGGCRRCRLRADEAVAAGLGGVGADVAGIPDLAGSVRAASEIGPSMAGAGLAGRTIVDDVATSVGRVARATGGRTAAGFGAARVTTAGTTCSGRRRATAPTGRRAPRARGSSALTARRSAGATAPAGATPTAARATEQACQRQPREPRRPFRHSRLQPIALNEAPRHHRTSAAGERMPGAGRAGPVSGQSSAPNQSVRTSGPSLSMISARKRFLS
jgi:hypothetical protein